VLDPSEGQSLLARGSYRDSGGNVVSVFEMQNVLQITRNNVAASSGVPMFICDTSNAFGVSSLAFANITPAMLTWCSGSAGSLMPSSANGIAPFDRVRLKALRILWEPSIHTASAGKMVMYIEYAGSHGLARDTSENAIAAISKLNRANNKKVFPVYSPEVITWHREDPIDDMYTRVTTHFRPVEVGSSTQYDHQFVAAILYSDESTPATDDASLIAGSFRVQAIVELTGSG
jgi:hypothetical protein